MSIRWIFALRWLAFCFAVLMVTPAIAEKKYGPGVSDGEIKVGQTMPYSGPLSAFGTMGRAEAAYFDMINATRRSQRAQDQVDLVGRWVQSAEDNRADATGWWNPTKCCCCSARSERRPIRLRSSISMPRECRSYSSRRPA